MTIQEITFISISITDETRNYLVFIISKENKFHYLPTSVNFPFSKSVRKLCVDRNKRWGITIE